MVGSIDKGASLIAPLSRSNTKNKDCGTIRRKGDDKIPAGAYHFAQGQISLVSGERVFPLDEKNLDLHLLEPLTRNAAVKILVRFYESIAVDKIPEAHGAQERAYVVLFERGGLWRGQLSTVEGVTYSAYGEGEKPRFYGSPENGTGESKWSLVEGTTG